MTSILYFLIALGVLIFVHELGHFILAKRQGIKVEVFSFGFGPRLIGIKRGETDYRLSLLPLGGYVKMLGQEPGEEGADDPRSFNQKTIWQRTKVIIFGPIMNIALAFIIMPIVFMIGRPQPVYLDQQPVIDQVRASSPAAEAGLKKGDRIVTVNGHTVMTWESVLNRALLARSGSEMKIGIERSGKTKTIDVKVSSLPEMQGGYVGIEPMLFVGNEATVDGVTPGGPAEKAGLKAGDVVLSYNGAKVIDWLDLTEKVNARGSKETVVSVKHADGTIGSVKLTPEFNESYDRWLMGIQKKRSSGVPMVTKRYSFFAAIARGSKENVKLLKLTFTVIKRLVTAQLSYKVLGGPIIIAKTSAAAASSGFAPFIYFLAFLSMQLGILNLLPIPVLDGGHLVFLGIETVMRRPLSIRVREVTTQVGFVMLISLMLLVTVNDINHVWGIKNLLSKIF